MATTRRSSTRRRRLLRGESTPFYLYRRDAQRRIRDLVPDARLIIILRDPVERAHSNWTHLWSSGLDPVGDFVQACGEEETRIAAGWADFWHYLALGRYGEQLEHLYTVFPRDQVLVFRYRTLLEQPATALNRICAFLRVPQGIVTEVPKENVTAHPDLTLRHRALSAALRIGHAIPGVPTEGLERMLQQDSPPRRPLTWAERRALIPRFEADIRLLERVTGEDFSDWLQPRGDSGGLVGARPPARARPRTGARGTSSAACDRSRTVRLAALLSRLLPCSAGCCPAQPAAALPAAALPAAALPGAPTGFAPRSLGYSVR